MSAKQNIYHGGTEATEEGGKWEGPVPLKKITHQAIQRLERRIILKVLERNHWNRRRVAKTLKISYRALLYKISEAGLSGRGGGVGLERSP